MTWAKIGLVILISFIGLIVYCGLQAAITSYVGSAIPKGSKSRFDPLISVSDVEYLMARFGKTSAWIQWVVLLVCLFIYAVVSTAM